MDPDQARAPNVPQPQPAAAYRRLDASAVVLVIIAGIFVGLAIVL